MKHVLSTYLLASVLLAAAEGGSGGGKSQADKAREAAAEANKKRQEDEAKKRSEAEGGGGDQGDQGEGPQPAGGLSEGGTAEAPSDLVARLDTLERLVRTLAAGMAGASGPAPGEAKDATATGSGASFDPPPTPGAAPGVTSSNALQPRPVVAAQVAAPAVMDPASLWNSDMNPKEPRAARTYMTLQDEDIRVKDTGYYDDVIRNPGEIIRGYTGPSASWFYPLSIEENGLVNQRALAMYNRQFVHRAPVYASE